MVSIERKCQPQDPCGAPCEAFVGNEHFLVKLLPLPAMISVPAAVSLGARRRRRPRVLTLSPPVGPNGAVPRPYAWRGGGRSIIVAHLAINRRPVRDDPIAEGAVISLIECAVTRPREIVIDRYDRAPVMS